MRRPSEEGFRGSGSPWVADAGIKRDVCENGSFIDLHSACIGSRGVEREVRWHSMAMSSADALRHEYHCFDTHRGTHAVTCFPLCFSLF